MKEIQELYEAYYHEIFQWFYWKCGNRSDALDLTQDTFLQVISSMHRYQGNCSERTWIYAIAKHLWLSYLRKKKTAVEFDEAMHQKVQLSTSYDLSEVLEKLKTSNPKQYEVVRYRLQGYSHQEIASAMHCSEASIRVLFHRVKQWMREEIERREQEHGM